MIEKWLSSKMFGRVIFRFVLLVVSLNVLLYVLDLDSILIIITLYIQFGLGLLILIYACVHMIYLFDQPIENTKRSALYFLIFIVAMAISLGVFWMIFLS